jgi:tetratricopeptide (TPR) repeat protein
MAQQQIWEIWVQAETAGGRILMSDGMVKMRTRDLAGALEAFTALTELEPELAEAWNKRATVHYMMGNFDASIADIEQVLALEPRHFGAHSGLGMIHDERGDLREAVKAFEAALENNPHMHGTRARMEDLKEQLRAQEI